MAVPGLDADRCRRRNRLAASLGELSIPVRFAAAAPPSLEATLIRAVGTVPEGEAAVRGINARLGLEGDAALKTADLHLVRAEVANSNFIPDRAMFLHSSTLKNIQAMAAEPGFAFLNSHRTGTASTDGELPFGWTYAGRYEVWEGADGRRFGRTLIGTYLRAGVKPNGDAGPTTDDLYAGIKAGTIRDVSVGLRPDAGELRCDVCGNELNGYDEETGRYLCPHVPGTTRKMTDEEIAAQQARGVPDGVASFSFVDGRPAEFSAVYEGAVPGASFRKARSVLRLASAGGERLARADVERLGRLYGEFLGTGDRGRLSRLRRSSRPHLWEGIMGLFSRGRGARVVDASGRTLGQLEIDEDDDDDGYDVPPARRRPGVRLNAGSGAEGERVAPPSARSPDPAVVALTETVAKLTAQIEQGQKLSAEKIRAEQLVRFRREAEAFAASMFRPTDGTPGQQILPSQVKSLADLHFAAARDDLDHPPGEGQPGRLAAVVAFARALPTRNLIGEFALPTPPGPDGHELPADDNDPLQLKAAAERARKFAEAENARHGGGGGGNGAAAHLN